MKRVPVRHDLAPRAEPTQARAQRTVEEILAAAGRLLDEVGFEAFNTNLLADRAGVRVRSVYRYFPNKMAVIAALARRMTEQWDEWLGDFTQLADPAADWRAEWHAAVVRFHDGVKAQPGGTAVRRAMRVSPELRAIDEQDNERLSARLARALGVRAARLSPARAHVVARNLIETAVAVIDLVIVERPPRSRAHLEELTRMHVAYVEALLTEHTPT